MNANPLLRCTECGRLSQQTNGEINQCEAREELGAVHTFEVYGK